MRFLFIVLASEIYSCIKITLSTTFQGWFFINAVLSAALSLILLKNAPEIFTAHLTTVSESITNLLKKAADIQRVQNYSDEFSITYRELHRRLRFGRGGERCLTLSIHRQTEFIPSTLSFYSCFLPPAFQKQEELMPSSIRRRLCAKRLRLKKLTVNDFLKSSQRLHNVALKRAIIPILQQYMYFSHLHPVSAASLSLPYCRTVLSFYFSSPPITAVLM